MGYLILGSLVSAIGSQVQVFSTRFGSGISLHLHPNLNTETRDLKMALSQSSGLRFPFELGILPHLPPGAATRHLKWMPLLVN